MKCWLKQIMKKAGKTTKELSKETGISKQTIEKYRNNKIHILYFRTLDKLCRCLNCDNTDLFK